MVKKVKKGKKETKNLGYKSKKRKKGIQSKNKAPLAIPQNLFNIISRSKDFNKKQRYDKKKLINAISNLKAFKQKTKLIYQNFSKLRKNLFNFFFW